MNNHPFPIDTSKQECLIAATVYFTLVTLYCCFVFEIGDGPREIADFEYDAIRIKRVLWNDPASGVMRHADAGYDLARQCAVEKGLNLPGILD